MSGQYRHAAHTWMFGGLPLESTMECLAGIGFCADLSIQDCGGSSPERIMELQEKRGVFQGMTPICTAMFTDEALNLSSADPAGRRRAVEFGKRCVEAARCVGADRLLVSPSSVVTGAGCCRSCEDDWRAAVESLREIGEFALGHEVSLMIEPINRYRVALVHTVAEALRMAEMTGLENVGVVPDVFHMCMEEASGVPEAIRSAGDRLLCLHIGSSTRNVPGADRFDWTPVLRSLRKTRYTGVLSYEPAALYFDEKRVERDAGYREEFLEKLRRGKEHLEELSNQMGETPSAGEQRP